MHSLSLSYAAVLGMGNSVGFLCFATWHFGTTNEKEGKNATESYFYATESGRFFFFFTKTSAYLN